MNANIAQLTLRAKHKWVDKQVIEQKNINLDINDDELAKDIAKEFINLDD